MGNLLVVGAMFVFALISFADKAVTGIEAPIRPEREASRWTNDRSELAIRSA